MYKQPNWTSKCEIQLVRGKGERKIYSFVTSYSSNQYKESTMYPEVETEGKAIVFIEQAPKYFQVQLHWMFLLSIYS